MLRKKPGVRNCGASKEDSSLCAGLPLWTSGRLSASPRVCHRKNRQSWEFSSLLMILGMSANPMEARDPHEFSRATNMEISKSCFLTRTRTCLRQPESALSAEVLNSESMGRQSRSRWSARRHGLRSLGSSTSCSRIGGACPQKTNVDGRMKSESCNRKRAKPNKAPEPTPRSVTPRATEGPSN